MKPLFSKTNIKKNIDTKRILIKSFMFSVALAFCLLGFLNTDSKVKNAAGTVVSMCAIPLIKIKMADGIEKELALKDGETQEQYSERVLIVKVSEEVKATCAKFLKDNPELKAIMESAEKAAKITDLDALKEAMNLLGLDIKALKEKPANEKTKKRLSEELKENKVALKALAKGAPGSGELEIKALANRAIISGNEQAFELPDIGQLATRKLSLYDLFPKLTLGENNNGVVRYYDWDKNTIIRAAAAVAEGGTFAESTAAFTTNTISLKKIGDTIPITEELMEDEEMFAAELEMFLNTNVNLEIDRQLYQGDGTANQITGIYSSVPDYTLPGAGDVVDASIYDLMVKLSQAITTNGGAKYTPNFAIMNIADINRMKLKKDGFNNYIIPPFVSQDGKQVAGINIIESNIVTADQLVIGDSKYARIYEKSGIVTEKGMVNAQFTADEITLKVRKRMLFLIRAADQNGFLRVASITAALAAINKV